ncbi:uncharacterized protein LOC114529378 [Dendronephthya gigantea]|uniref:uncharacterized protein LOC114529378 n=1 Tax=Dendronephthya gigantea TaxID=151771 RepID=UPI00106C80F4|nr:uncharacterized protein LOC114529378 [Dendronephthya gigantea]
MEVMTPINFTEVLQKKLHGISKQYFSYGTSVKDQDFAPYKPKSKSLHVQEEKTVNSVPTNQKRTHSLVSWGCGEFGQHGQDLKGDVTLEMALNQLRGGGLMLPDGEFPLNSVCGSSHTLALTDTGNLYSWGNGTSGQLGNGTCLTTIKPMLVPLKLNGNIQDMACGARHSFIWTNTGYCYSFGNNFNAQLGYNFSKADFKENQLQPVLVELFPDMKVKEVACGARHSLFLLATGFVMAVGCNQHGQIGNATTDDAVIPTKIDCLSSITHVACGNIHSLVSLEGGAVFAWGYGKAFGNRTRIVSTPQSFTLENMENSSVISLAGGDCHSMILCDSGIVYTWGNNYEGQLGVDKSIKYQSKPEPIPGQFLPRPVKQIACGETTSAAVTETGKLYMWGKNAGLIYPHKPSQYFQYLPYHMDMGDLTVVQVSVGAWHVSVVIEKAKSVMENDLENFHVESNEKDKLCLTDLKLNLAELKLPCDDCRDDNLTGHGDNTNRNEVLKINGNPLDGGCSQSNDPVNNGGSNVPESSESSFDKCFITKYMSSSNISRQDIAQHYNAEIEATDLVKNFKGHSPDNSEEKSFITRTDNTSWKPVHRRNSMENEDTSSCNEQPGFLETHKNHESETKDLHITEKQMNDINQNTTSVDVCQGNEITESRNISEDEIPVAVSNSNPLKPPRAYTLQFEKEDKIDLETCKTRTKKYLANKSEYTRNNLNADTFAASIWERNEQEENNCLQTPSEMTKEKGLMVHIRDNHTKNNDAQRDFRRNKNCSKDDQFQGFDREFEVKETRRNEIKKSNNFRREDVPWKNDVKQQNNSQSFYDWQEYYDSITTSPSARNPDSINKRNISGFSFDSFDEHMTTTGIRQNARVRKDKEVRSATTPQQNSFVKPTYNKQHRSIDCIDELGSRPHTVPVIDLSFGKTVGNAEQGITKPRYSAFKNVWKTSSLLREKQERLNKESEGSYNVNPGFKIGNLLPSRYNFAVREMKERSMISNDSTKKMRKKSEKLIKCCHHTGDLLPPICSCKKK